MTKNIPSKWHKITLITTGALTILNIVATWLAYGLATKGAIAFGGIMGSFLTLAMVALFVFLFIDGKADHKKYSYIFGGLGILHLLFFILVLCFTNVLGFPIIHTLVLAGIIGFGIYFWIKSKFTFRTKSNEPKPAEPTNNTTNETKTPEQPVVEQTQKPQQESEQPKENKPDIVSI